MLDNNGFKWDDDRKMISLERKVYDEYYKISMQDIEIHYILLISYMISFGFTIFYNIMPMPETCMECHSYTSMR